MKKEQKTSTTFILQIRSGQQQPQSLHFTSLQACHDYITDLYHEGCKDFSFVVSTIQSVEP